MSFSSENLYKYMDFDVYPTAVLGTNFKNLKFMAILDPDTAAVMGNDIASLHAAVYPTLPAPAPQTAFDYSYVKMRDSEGKDIVLGIPWVNESSIVIKTSSTVRITVEDVDPSQMGDLKAALVSNGFNATKIEQVI